MTECKDFSIRRGVEILPFGYQMCIIVLLPILFRYGWYVVQDYPNVSVRLDYLINPIDLRPMLKVTWIFDLLERLSLHEVLICTFMGSFLLHRALQRRKELSDVLLQAVDSPGEVSVATRLLYLTLTSHLLRYLTHREMLRSPLEEWGCSIQENACESFDVEEYFPSLDSYIGPLSQYPESFIRHISAIGCVMLVPCTGILSSIAFSLLAATLYGLLRHGLHMSERHNLLRFWLHCSFFNAIYEVALFFLSSPVNSLIEEVSDSESLPAIVHPTWGWYETIVISFPIVFQLWYNYRFGPNCAEVEDTGDDGKVNEDSPQSTLAKTENAVETDYLAYPTDNAFPIRSLEPTSVSDSEYSTTPCPEQPMPPIRLLDAFYSLWQFMRCTLVAYFTTALVVLIFSAVTVLLPFVTGFIYVIFLFVWYPAALCVLNMDFIVVASGCVSLALQFVLQLRSIDTCLCFILLLLVTVLFAELVHLARGLHTHYSLFIVIECFIAFPLVLSWTTSVFKEYSVLPFLKESIGMVAFPMECSAESSLMLNFLYIYSAILGLLTFVHVLSSYFLRLPQFPTYTFLKKELSISLLKVICMSLLCTGFAYFSQYFSQYVFSIPDLGILLLNICHGFMLLGIQRERQEDIRNALSRMCGYHRAPSSRSHQMHYSELM